MLRFSFVLFRCSWRAEDATQFIDKSPEAVVGNSRATSEGSRTYTEISICRVYRVFQNCGTIRYMQYPDAKRHRKVFHRFGIRDFGLQILTVEYWRSKFRGAQFKAETADRAEQWRVWIQVHTVVEPTALVQTVKMGYRNLFGNIGTPCIVISLYDAIS